MEAGRGARRRAAGRFALTASRKARVFLCALVLAGAAMRVESIRQRREWSHDDAMAIAMSSGATAASWAGLEGRWLPAARWQELLSRTAGSPAPIGSTGHVDVHPPLWLRVVDVATRAFGVNLWSVPALNLAFAVGTGALLFLLARALLGDPDDALLAVALWALSPGAIDTTAMERSYELLALLTVGMAWLVLTGPAPRQRPAGARVVGIAALSVAGLLLHYLFAIVLAASLAVLLAAPRHPLRARAPLVGALLLGPLALPFLHPGLRESFSLARRMSERPEGAATTILERIANPAQPVNVLVDGSFFAPAWTEPWSVLLLLSWTILLAVLLAGAVRSLRRRGDVSVSEAVRAWPAGRAVLFGATILLAVEAAFVLGLTPPHAATPRYVSNAWPFVAIGVAAAARSATRARGFAGLAAALLMLATAFVHVRSTARAATRGAEGVLVLAEADAVVVDNPSLGVVPRIVSLLAPRTPVFVAWGEALLQRPDDWRRGVPADAQRVAVVSSHYPWDANVPQRQDAVRRLAEDAWGPARNAGPLLRVGTLTVFDRPPVTTPGP